jgi:hypothetical protein
MGSVFGECHTPCTLKTFSGGDVCDCCFGEQLDNKKPFRPLYIFKHMLKNNFVLFIRECRITTGQKCKVQF